MLVRKELSRELIFKNTVEYNFVRKEQETKTDFILIDLIGSYAIAKMTLKIKIKNSDFNKDHSLENDFEALKVCSHRFPLYTL